MASMHVEAPDWQKLAIVAALLLPPILLLAKVKLRQRKKRPGTSDMGLVLVIAGMIVVGFLTRVYFVSVVRAEMHHQ